jgi:hypothetical protein
MRYPVKELANMGAIWPILSAFGGGLGHENLSLKLASTCEVYFD